MTNRRKSIHRIAGLQLAGESEVRLAGVPLRPGFVLSSENVATFRSAVAEFCVDGLTFHLSSQLPSDSGEPLGIAPEGDGRGRVVALHPNFAKALFAASDCGDVRLASIATAWMAWALRLFVQADVHYDGILTQAQLWRNVGSPAFHHPTPFLLDDAATLRLSAFFEALSGITEMFSSDRRLSRAIQFYDRAYDAEEAAERLFFVVASLDASISPMGPEASHRIAQRVARLLGAGPDDALRLYRLCRLSYSLRSKVAHGESFNLTFDKGSLGGI